MTKREKMVELLALFSSAENLNARLKYCDKRVFKIAEAARRAIVDMTPAEEVDVRKESEALAEEFLEKRVAQDKDDNRDSRKLRAVYAQTKASQAVMCPNCGGDVEVYTSGFGTGKPWGYCGKCNLSFRIHGEPWERTLGRPE